MHGFLEIPSYSDRKVNYKLTSESKVEKFLTNDLEELTFVDNKTTFTLLAKNVYPSSVIKKQVDYSKDKFWMVLIHDGKIKIYYNYVTSMTGLGYNKIPSQKTDIDYLVQEEGRDYPHKFVTVFGGMVVGQFNYIKKVVEVTFKDICPNLVNLLDKKDIMDNGVYRIGEIYDKNCGK